MIAMRAARLGINFSKLKFAIESEGDNRGMLGLDDRISAGMSGLRTMAADNAGPVPHNSKKWSNGRISTLPSAVPFATQPEIG